LTQKLASLDSAAPAFLRERGAASGTRNASRPADAVPLIERLRLLRVQRWDGAVRIGEAKGSGVIYLHKGQVVHAEYGRIRGEFAYWQLLGLPSLELEVELCPGGWLCEQRSIVRPMPLTLPARPLRARAAPAEPAISTALCAALSRLVGRRWARPAQAVRAARRDRRRHAWHGAAWSGGARSGADRPESIRVGGCCSHAEPREQALRCAACGAADPGGGRREALGAEPPARAPRHVGSAAPSGGARPDASRSIWTPRRIPRTVRSRSVSFTGTTIRTASCRGS
jgi:hypothetical protein